MQKYLRQFAPFVALVVAAALVVIANPADTGDNSDDDAEVAGIAASRTGATTTTAIPAAAADVPTGVEAPVDAVPFAPPSSSSSTPSFSSAPSSTSSSGSFSSAVDTTPAFVPPTTVAAGPTTTVTFPAEIPTPSTTIPTDSGSSFFLFDQVAASSACSAGGNTDKPLDLASQFVQSKIASEPSFPDRAGGIALNKADPDPERYIYRTHSLLSTSSVSVTDTAANNSTRILSQRSDWERLDGIVWTPAKTILVGENIKVQEKTDPNFATAKAGLVYEIDPFTGFATARPALGSKAHRGMAFDHLGNLYSVSATNPGYVYRYVPASANNYSSGSLYALWAGSNGESMWLLLNGAIDPKIDADAAAAAAGATAFLSPEDAETLTVTAPNGSKRSQLFIAEQGANRVLTVILRTSPNGLVADNTAFTATYVAPGVNAPTDFAAPSDLMLDTPYNLYIAERNGGGTETAKSRVTTSGSLRPTRCRRSSRCPQGGSRASPTATPNRLV